MIVTYRYRVKDKHRASLKRMAKAVNYVWNYCNDVQKQALRRQRKWPSGYDLMKLTSGSSVDLGIPATCINQICKQYERSRRQSRKARLRYRGVRSLGWIPMRAENIRFHEGMVRFYGKVYSVWRSRDIPDEGRIVDGCTFGQDARGRWYINIVVELPDAEAVATGGAVGVDLGLKELAVLSTRERIIAPQHYRRTQGRLVRAQRAKKKRQIKKIHDRIASQRRDFLHKVSRDIVSRYGTIVVGNVNSSGLAKTKMAKSVLDAGWRSFRKMLAYKSIANGARYLEVNEAFTTQTCSECGSISGPKGREGLGVREWRCDCGSVHDRDVNSAVNILRIGQDTLTGIAA